MLYLFNTMYLLNYDRIISHDGSPKWQQKIAVCFIFISHKHQAWDVAVNAMFMFTKDGCSLIHFLLLL